VSGTPKGRVTVVTNGNYFANLALASLLAGPNDELELQVIVTTGLRKQSGNRFVEAWQLLRRWGLAYFAYKVATYAIPWLVELVGRRPRTVATTCRRRGIPCSVVRNVNRPEVVARISAFAPDILLSVSCPYRIKQRLLDVPRLGSLNLHSSLLPAYAGVCTYIHVLARGECRTGITLHEMVSRFDAGRIVAQEALAMEGPTTVCALFRRLCRMASPMLRTSLQAILATGCIRGADQDPARRSYCGEPTRQDIAELRRQGHGLLSWRDVRLMVAGAPSRDRRTA